MRVIIMKVILNVGYNRYLMDVTDAAKVMELLGKGVVMKAVYDETAQTYTFRPEEHQSEIAITTPPYPIEGV